MRTNSNNMMTNNNQNNNNNNTSSSPTSSLSTTTTPGSSHNTLIDFPSVLHFLQREYRRMEADRQLWELERVEYKRTIHYLESCRKSHERIQFDLLRRIKMLEFVLQSERLKFNTLNDEIRAMDDTSNDPHQVRDHLLNRIEQLTMNPPISKSSTTSTTSSTTNNNNNNNNNTKSVSSQVLNMEYPPKSAQMLRKCLDDLNCSDVWSLLSTIPSESHVHELQPEHVGSMTMMSKLSSLSSPTSSSSSPASLSPSITNETTTNGIADNQKNNSHDHSFNNTSSSPVEPNNVLHMNNNGAYDSTDFIVPKNNNNSDSPTFVDSSNNVDNNNNNSNNNNNNNDDDESLSEQMARKFPSLSRYSSNSMKKSSSSSSSSKKKRNSVSGSSTNSSSSTNSTSGSPSVDLKLEPNDAFGKYQATASQDAEALEDMLQEQQQRRKRQSSDSSSNSSVSTNSGTNSTNSTNSSGGLLQQSSKIWKQKFVLSSHLDSVRSLCFHPSQPWLITASEDETLKLWNVDRLGKRSMDPVHTFRAHTAAVFSVKCNDQFIVSAGEDGTVRVWNYPPLDHDPYTNHGCASPFEHLCLSGHQDAIWSLSFTTGMNGGNGLLLSASADETIRVWNMAHVAAHEYVWNDASPVPSSDHYLSRVIRVSSTGGGDGDGGSSDSSSGEESSISTFTPTCVTALPTDSSRFIVGSTGGELAMVDIETGKTIWRRHVTNGATTGASTAASVPDMSKLVYRCVIHGSLPLIATGCEDGKIRFHDMNGQLVNSGHNVLGHSDAVSALDFSPCGQYLMSGGYDCSLRIWDIHSRNCVQEIPTHRRKYSEGIHDVAYHATKSLVATCGADSLAKIYQ